jgi:hypothetical protein
VTGFPLRSIWKRIAIRAAWLFLLDFKGVLHRTVFSQDQYNAFFTDPAAAPFIRYANPFKFFKNRPSHCNDFSKDGAHDIKWGQLISIY